MADIPKFNTKSPWELPFQAVELDPGTGSRRPRSKWDYDEIEVIYRLLNRIEVGRASLQAGTVTITDNALRKFTIAIPVAGRPAVPVKGEALIVGDGYGRKGSGEPDWLGRSQVLLVEGA